MYLKHSRFAGWHVLDSSIAREKLDVHAFACNCPLLMPTAATNALMIDMWVAGTG
jgi:hypothetical protein